MIRFEPVTAEIVLDCDQDPKTRFRLRSLSFSDEQAIARKLETLGEFPAATLRALSKHLGEGSELTDAEAAKVDRILEILEVKKRLICSRGITEIDCKEVNPEQVLEMLGAIPEAQREEVVEELAIRIKKLGQPDPKFSRPSGSPLGSGRTAITTGGVANSAT